MCSSTLCVIYQEIKNNNWLDLTLKTNDFSVIVVPDATVYVRSGAGVLKQAVLWCWSVA